MALDSGKKDRHIVSWTPEEDDVLREQVRINGTENWTSIAAKFKDKTSRQCRRRWYTYLNTDCKKGEWSAEEDKLLCEAQKKYGNRWTEISKVVSGRTDNAVKNRFNTLSKKRAKTEVSINENDVALVDVSNKNVTWHNSSTILGTSESSSKKIRSYISDDKENHYGNESLYVQCGKMKEVSRSPLAVITQNAESTSSSATQHYDLKFDKDNLSEKPKSDSECSFLRRDDPRFSALLGQAELLTTLAKKVNSDNSSESLEEAWKELRDYLVQTGEYSLLDDDLSNLDFLLDNFKDLIDDFSQSDKEVDPVVRQLELQINIPSVGATPPSNALACVAEQYEKCLENPDHTVVGGNEDGPYHVTIINEETHGTTSTLPNCNEVKETTGSTSAHIQYGSPVQTVPLFRSFAEVIPSPKFTASERQFLLNLLDLSPPNFRGNTSQQPMCKRSLLHML